MEVFHELLVGGTSGSGSLCDPILRETQMPFSVVFSVVHGGDPRESPMPFVLSRILHLVLWLTRLSCVFMCFVHAGMWCILVCHAHLTIIVCCTVVWAQACGVERKTSFVIIFHLWFI